MIGVLLCGGQSTRMGKDKGLLFSQKKTWAEIMREKFEQISIPSFLSINSAQKEEYLHYFNEVDLVVDPCCPGCVGEWKVSLVHLRSTDFLCPDALCLKVGAQYICVEKT